MNFSIKLTLILGLSALTPIYGTSEKVPQKGHQFSRPLIISAGFLPGCMTNESFIQTGIALEKSTGWIFDQGHNWLKPKETWTRVSYKYFIYPLLMDPFYKALRISVDAYGKASRIEALGGKAIYVDNTYETYAENYGAMFIKNLLYSYKDRFLGGFNLVDVVPSAQQVFQSPYASDFVKSTIDNTALQNLQTEIAKLKDKDYIDFNKITLKPDIALLRDNLDDYLTPKGKVLVRTAGYNARMQHARYIEDTLWYDGGGHMTQLYNHMMYKLSYTYEGMGMFSRSDIGKTNSHLGRIQQAYKDMNIDISWKEMTIYGTLAFIGSAEFWARLFEKSSYTSCGETYIKSPEMGGFRLPNFGFYLTTYGPSYQINTGYRVGQHMFFPFALEAVFKGPNKHIEITTGIRKQFKWMSSYVHGEVIGNMKTLNFGCKLMAGFQPKNLFLVDIGLRYDHKNTLDGERNIRSLKDGNGCFSVLGSVGIKF